MTYASTETGHAKQANTTKVESPPAMGWLWGVIGLGLLAWLVILIVVGDDANVTTDPDAGPAVVSQEADN